MSTTPHAPRIVLSGAYGMGNLGDEAICRSLMKDIEGAYPGAGLRVFTFDDRASRLAHPLVSEARFREFFSPVFRPWSIRSWVNVGKGIWEIFACDLFIFGGGGLVRNRMEWLRRYLWPLRLAQWFRKPIAICCIGVDALTDPQVIRLIQRIRHPVFVSVRDEESKRNLLQVHPSLAPVKVVADPAFHVFKNVPRATTKSPSIIRIGLNLTTWKADFSERKQVDAFVNGLVLLLDTMAKSGKEIQIVYLSTVPKKDAEIYQHLQDRLADKYPADAPLLQTPEAYVAHLASLDLFVGMRLHSLILSSLVGGLPTSVISYDEKTDALQSVFNERFFRIADVMKRPEDVAKSLMMSLGDPSFAVDWTKARASSETLVFELACLLSEGKIL